MMLNLFRRRETAASPGHREQNGADEVIRVLALTQEPNNWRSLQAIADGEKWELLWASSSDRARDVISRHHVLIVICDRNLPNEDWRTILTDLAKMRPRVCTLLASDVSDEYLWREVVQNRGFEVVTKPFEPGKVARMIRFAAIWHGWAMDSGQLASGHNALTDGVKD